MSSERLRVTRNNAEIKGFFLEYIRRKSPVLLWQNMDGIPQGQDGDKRIIFNGYFAHFDEKKQYLVLEYKTGPMKKPDFAKNSTLYIKGDLSSILFKADIQYHSSGKLLMPLPKEIRVLEKREDPRTDFGYEFNGRVEFSKVNQYNMSKKSMSARIVNISKGGAAILLFSGAHNWTEGDTLQIFSICKFEFSFPIDAEVRNIRTVQIERNNQFTSGFRIGLQFKRKLEEKELQDIITLSCEIT